MQCESLLTAPRPSSSPSLLPSFPFFSSAAAGGEFFPWANTGADPLLDGFGSSAHSEGSDGNGDRDRDDFSAISMNSGSFPEWDHDTDDGACVGLHGITDGTREVGTYCL